MTSNSTRDGAQDSDNITSDAPPDGAASEGAKANQRGQSAALAALWLGFVVYAFVAAPPSSPDTADTILQLSTGQWDGLNSWVVALFNCMGLWPLVYAGLTLADGHRQPLPAWPFVIGSFALGAFALLPYLALRRSRTAAVPLGTVGQWLNRPWLGWGIAIAALILFAYPWMQPGGIHAAWLAWQDFCQQWQQSRFIHVMSLDFCLLTLLTPTLFWDDMADRGLNKAWRALCLVPLVGPALYLALRPND